MKRYDPIQIALAELDDKSWGVYGILIATTTSADITIYAYPAGYTALAIQHKIPPDAARLAARFAAETIDYLRGTNCAEIFETNS